MIDTIEIKEIITKGKNEPWYVYKPENIYHQSLVDKEVVVHKGYWRDCQVCMNSLSPKGNKEEVGR